MPTFVADLHNHTPASADHHLRHETSARDIVETALAAGLDIYAATDHMSWGLVGELLAAADDVARETGRTLLVVPGAELRITYRGDEAHITPLFDPGTYEQRFDALVGILGLTSTLVAEEDRPFFTFEHDPVDVCRIVYALGGVACVAHADRAFGEYRLTGTHLFERLLAEPTVAAIDFLDPEAARGLVDGTDATVISCSDSHCCEDIGRRRSDLELDDLSFWALRTALVRDGVRAGVCA